MNIMVDIPQETILGNNVISVKRPYVRILMYQNLELKQKYTTQLEKQIKPYKLQKNT